MAAVVTQKSRRSAPFAIFLFRLAPDAQARVRQRIQSLEADLFAALLAPPELLRSLVEPAQGLVDVPEEITRLNSSHLVISYAVFCLKKKNYILRVLDH